jgi:hypothetical protein
MMGIASGYSDHGQGGFVVRRPRVTDAIGGALLRSFDAASSLPEDMLRLLERLDRQPLAY